MNGAIDLLINAQFQTDADMQGHKLLNLDTSNLGAFENQVPFADSDALIKGSADATKLARFEVDGFTTATTRVFTLPNFNGTLATIAGTEDLTNKTVNGITFGGTGGFTLADGIVSVTGELLTDGNISIGSGHDLVLTTTGNTSLILPLIGTVATTAQLPVISDVAYNEATWNGNLDGASKNAIRDKFEGLSAAIPSAPFLDTTAIVKGSADATKLLRFEVDGFTTGTTRVLTAPNYDGTISTVAGSESLINKAVNAVTLAAGTAPDSATAPTYGLLAGASLNVVGIAPQVSMSVVLRTTAPVDIVLPVTGTLATVAGTIPFSYLSTKSDLNGAAASDAKVPSELAIYTFVNAHTGAGPKAVSDDTVASATSVDLSGFTDYQIAVTGTTDIEVFILDEGDEHVLVFDDELMLKQGIFLSLQGGQDTPVKAGSYVIVRGLAGAVAEVILSKNAEGYKQDVFDNAYLNSGGNIGFGNLLGPYFDVGRSVESGTLGMFMRFTEGDFPTLIKHDLTTSISFDGSLATSGRTMTFPDSDGTFGLLVAAPSAVLDPGENGQWARDNSFLYVYNSAGGWGRTDLDYAWP